MDRRGFLEAMTAVPAAGLVGLSAVGDTKVEVSGRGAVAQQRGTVEVRQSKEETILENGLLRVVFNHRQGEFRAHSMASGGIVELLEAGPVWETMGKKFRAREAKKVEVKPEPFEDELGEGEKLVVEYEWEGQRRTVRYDLKVYRGKGWVSVTAYLPRGNYGLGEFEVVRGKVRVPGAFKTRLYVCSGTAGGDSGVWALGMRRWASAAVSVLYEPEVQEAIGIGFYSFYRASTTVVSQYLKGNEVGVSGVAHYHGYQPKEGELRTESLLLNFSPMPLKVLEEWAESAVKVVQPNFIHDAHTGCLNTWYMYGSQASEEDAIKQAKLLRDSVLLGYGIKIVTTGEWQLQHRKYGDAGGALGFGEDQVDKRLYPHGVKWLVDRIRALGLEASFGANYCYANLESKLVKENAPWIIKEDRSRMGFGYPIDFTHPDAQKWLYNLAHRVAEFKCAEWWSDFMGGPTRGNLHDPTKIMGFEDIREGLKVIRKAVGPGVIMEPACCGPYFTYIGLVDRDRTGNDIPALGNWEGLKTVARQLAALHMAHQRFWITNPDPLYVGGRDYVHNPASGPIPSDPTMLDEVRMRLQLQLSTGGFVTIGQNMEDFDAERIRLLTLVLPTYGQAARPLDLFEHTTPEVHDLKVKSEWEEWHVLMLQNWNDEEKSYEIAFRDLDLDEGKRYQVFRFWDQAYLGQHRQGVRLKVGSRQGETYVIREAREHPWVLSTDLHLTQGGMELAGVQYEQELKELRGIASRHAGAEGHVVVYVPGRYKVKSASGAYRVDEQASGEKVVHLELKFQQKTSPWSLQFEKLPSLASSSSLVTGGAGLVGGGGCSTGKQAFQ